MLSFLSHSKKEDLKKVPRAVIYGVTDRTKDSLWTTLEEWFIDNSRVTDKDKEFMYSSLELLIRAGLKFTKAIKLMAKRSKNERLRRILRTMAYDIENRGMSFSQSMRKYPKIFDSSEVKMIYSGEVTGKLEQTLGSISEQVQKNLQLKMQVRSALMYPIVVLGAIFMAIGVVVQFIIPSLAKMFEEFEADLPMATQAMLWISEFVKAYWWVLLAGGGLLVSLFLGWKRTYEGKRVWDRFWLRAPMVSPIVQNIQTVKIAGNFSTLLSAGVPVARALRILAEMVSNSVISDSVFVIEQRIVKGEKLYVCFQDNPYFDEVLGEVIEVGEKGGQVAEVLEKTAKQYQMELDHQLKNLMTIMEPLVIVLVGAAVGLMAVSILTPILQLTTLFSTG